MRHSFFRRLGRVDAPVLLRVWSASTGRRRQVRWKVAAIKSWQTSRQHIVGKLPLLTAVVQSSFFRIRARNERCYTHQHGGSRCTTNLQQTSGGLRNSLCHSRAHQNTTPLNFLQTGDSRSRSTCYRTAHTCEHFTPNTCKVSVWTWELLLLMQINGSCVVRCCPRVITR